MFVEDRLESTGDGVLARVVQTSHENDKSLFQTGRITFSQGFYNRAEGPSDRISAA
jgi:hypothetical protein